jgi:hypothetical protein
MHDIHRVSQGCDMKFWVSASLARPLETWHLDIDYFLVPRTWCWNDPGPIKVPCFDALGRGREEQTSLKGRIVTSCYPVAAKKGRRVMPNRDGSRVLTRSQWIIEDVSYWFDPPCAGRFMLLLSHANRLRSGHLVNQETPRCHFTSFHLGLSESWAPFYGFLAWETVDEPWVFLCFFPSFQTNPSGFRESNNWEKHKVNLNRCFTSTKGYPKPLVSPFEKIT